MSHSFHSDIIPSFTMSGNCELAKPATQMRLKAPNQSSGPGIRNDSRTKARPMTPSTMATLPIFASYVMMTQQNTRLQM
jgi:hypothetical protein